MKSDVERLSDVGAIQSALDSFGKGHLILPEPSSPQANAAVIVGATMRALRSSGWPRTTIEIVAELMTSGNHDNLINTAKFVCDCYRQEITLSRID